MIIKVCGMREPDNIRAVSQLDIDMMGFIFYPKSPRYVQMISSRAGIIPDYSLERYEKGTGRKTSQESEKKKLPKRVGVFVDDMPQNIVTRVYNYNLDYVQLHGEEPRTTCENLRRTLDPDIHPEIKIIKAISVKTPEDIDKYKEYVGDEHDAVPDIRPRLGPIGFEEPLAYDASGPFGVVVSQRIFRIRCAASVFYR
jgi:phosphoribosylanthranilate isomerase